METMKIDRLKIVPNYRKDGLSIIDIDGTYKRSFPEWFTLITVSTGNSELDEKIKSITIQSKALV